MPKLFVLVPLLLGSLLAAPAASAATYEAHVEKGNIVVVTGTSKKAEAQRCATKVGFNYTDPKLPEKRQFGFQVCPATRITPGKPTEMCRLDYPVTDITLAGKVTVTECFPN